jgi:hypothetical protein
VLAFAYVVTLPMRQAPFSLRDHAIVRQGQEAAIEGVLQNRGGGAPAVRVEAYLYDGDRRYLATLERTYRDVPARSVVRVHLPIDPALAARAERYSLYAGIGPNPFAPDGD